MKKLQNHLTIFAIFFFLNGNAFAQDLPQGVKARVDIINKTLDNFRQQAQSTSKPDLHILQGLLLKADSDYHLVIGSYLGRFDENHSDWQALTKKLNDARARYQDLLAQKTDKAVTSAQQLSPEQKNKQAIAKIQTRYTDQGDTGKAHRQNMKKIVWASKAISLKQQDSITHRDSFSLSEPIFGRIYLEHSIGNTPVYAQGSNSPSVNHGFGYEVRLLVNGNNVPIKFGVFDSGQLKYEDGKKSTSWEFSPNPVPYNEDFKSEAKAWRKATRGLLPGKHNILFEVWAVQGQSYSKTAIASGKFTLSINKGEHLSLGSEFPADQSNIKNLDEIRNNMKTALIGTVANNTAEILDISVTSGWSYGIYTDNQKKYRIVRGAVLWADTNNDKVCRYTTYNFVSNITDRETWTPLLFRSICSGCPEGDAVCP